MIFLYGKIILLLYTQFVNWWALSIKDFILIKFMSFLINQTNRSYVSKGFLSLEEFSVLLKFGNLSRSRRVNINLIYTDFTKLRFGFSRLIFKRVGYI